MRAFHPLRLPRCLTGLLVCVGLLIGAGSIWATCAESGNLEHFQRQTVYGPATFLDVQARDWFYDNVKTAYEYGLMVGTGPTTFDPNGNVTIAETITVAARLHALLYTGNGQFEPSEPWYQSYVDYAAKHKIIATEYTDYNRAATRAEYATILSATFPDAALAKINQVPDNSIPDVKVSDAYGKAVYRLYRAGVLTGINDMGTFSANSNIQRSEVAAIVSRMADPNKRLSLDLDRHPNNNSSSVGSSSTATAEPEPMVYGPAFVLEGCDAKRGEKNLAVPVTIKNNPGIASVGLTISYDSALTLTDIVYNDELGGNYMLPPAMNNPVKLVWISPFADIEGDQVLATLYFNVSDDAALGQQQIAAVYDPGDVFNMAMDDIAFDVVNGSIHVTE